MSDTKQYILDPLTTICKLALLHFLPEGTKLSIGYHVLHIQENSMLQWVERMRNGDTRCDLSYLLPPIVKGIKWYILDISDDNIKQQTYQSIRKIAVFSIKGLEKMQKYTYEKDPTMQIIIQYLINLFRDSLEDKWDDDKLCMIEHDNILSEKIRSNIDQDMISSISKMLVDASNFVSMQNNIKAMVECTHKLLLNRDEIFVNMMKEINTTM